MSPSGVEGRWTVWLCKDCGQRAHYQDRCPKDRRRIWTQMVEVPVVPCDAEAVARVADELRSMLGDVPLDFRELAEMALRAADDVSDPSSTTPVPASERLGPEADNHV